MILKAFKKRFELIKMASLVKSCEAFPTFEKWILK